MFHPHRTVLSVLVAVGFLAGGSAWARIGTTYQMALGNPDGATTNSVSRTKFLINQRTQYAISYNDDTHQANWVSWSYSSADDGSQARTDDWKVEELLPPGYLRIGTATFGTSYGISWDRGHMTPSADRTLNFNDNSVTFRMSNIIPQADANNQGLWAQFETYCRGLATGGNEVLIISGPSEFTGNRIGNSMSVPGSVWKIVVVVPNATSATPAAQRITTSSRVIAILTPNVSSGLGSWQSYITSVEQIEEVTGFNFFTELDPSTAIYLKNVVDTGTAPNNPTVITTFNPTLGAAGSSVVISGYNFNASSTVQFNGIEAAVTFNSQNQLTATVPPGATTGLITVNGTGGSDTSYEPFTVSAGPVTPAITVSPASISGMTSTEGSPGAARNYAVNGSSLTAPVVITAPTNFEISTDGAAYSSSLSLAPSIDGSLGTQISVRIKSSAPVGEVSGQIIHASTGATAQNVGVAGTVASSAPHIIISTANLAGFAALQGSVGSSKSYTVSGANLTGSITITAPSGYEVSLDNSTFAATRTLTPVGGAIASTTVYARLSVTAPLGPNTGVISHAGGSATTQNVSVSGTVSTSGGASSDIYWDFLTAAPTSGVPSGMTVGNLAQGNNNGTTTLLTTTSASTGYVGASGTSNAGAAARTGVLSTALGGSAYFEFTVTPASAGIFTLNGISFGTRSTTTGPQAYTLRSSADNYAADIVTGLISNNSVWSLKTHIALAQSYSSATTFRLYGHNGAGTANTGTANWRIDDLKLTVSAGSSSPPSPVITVSGPAAATALQSFTYQIQANNDPTSYAASGLPEGVSINSSTGVISGTWTTPGTYTVGLTASNATGDGTATLTINVQANPNAPVITSALIASGYINTPFSYQITATNSPTSFTAANLPAGLGINTATGLIEGTPTSGGTTSATITAVNEFGSDSKTLQIAIRVPTLTITPSTLQPFEATAGSTSQTQSYTLTGTDLAGPVTVRAPQNFELSTDGSNFSEELPPLTPAPDGSLSRGIIVRLRASAPAGLTSGAIAHTSSAAVPIYLNLTGTVSTPSPTLLVSSGSLAPFNTKPGTASETASYELSGASLDGDVTVTAPPRFEIATIDSEFADTIILQTVNSTLAATTIRVRVRADAPVGSYFGSIIHSSTGVAPRNVTVSATVATPTLPNIITTSGGSAYRGINTFSFTIQTDGTQTISSYGATGLPPGMNVNTSNGLVSGTPTAAGTYNVMVTATGPQGTASKPYTLRVIENIEQPATPTVVVNKYHDSSFDRVELLVIGDNSDGPPVDLRGMIIKDFNASMASDTGGKYVFNNHPLWANVRAGTLIVLSAGNTLGQDFEASGEDFLLQVNLANPTYFTQESGGFNIVATDMVMIKPAGMQPDGVAGGMHALAAGRSGSQFSTFTGRKLRSNNPLSGSQGYFCMASSPNQRLDDFWANNGGQIASDETFGTGNTADNTAYINQLRSLDQTGPDINILGSNPASINRGTAYQDAGATAFDQGDNQNKNVTSASNVNAAVVGIYTVTYTATDSSGNIGTATRTVQVVTPASIPPTVASSPSDSVSASSATLNGIVVSEGSPSVTTRGFVFGISAAALEIGAEGTTALYTGAGAGPFTASATLLSPGTTYHFRAFATNEAGTVYGETLSFTTLKAEPPSHVTSFAAGTITKSGIAATWNTAEADGYLLIVGSGVQAQPVDGTPVADDTDASDGTGAINLPGSTASFSGFSGFASGVNYTFQIFPYNNSGAAIDYKTTGEAPAFSASVVTTPAISLAGSPSALTTTYGTPSSPTSFTVSGTYLASTVEVAAPAGFEVSADGQAFAASVILSPESGSLSATSVFLRLAATATVAGSYDNQTITATSSGANAATTATAATGNSVAPKSLTITGLSAADKIYDGNTDVAILGAPSYDGLANNESFPVSGDVSWAFGDKNVGTGKTLVRSGNFDAPSANYIIATQPSLTASITAKPLTVTGASVAPKTYDGSTAATVTGATLAGVIEGDTVTVSGDGAFGGPNAGENKPVTANLTLQGADAGNYSLVQPSLTGTITKADQTITFGALPAKSANDDPFTLSASASSGLAVTYASSNKAVASVSGNVVALASPGIATITASQPGNGNYNAAAPVAQTLAVSAAQYLVAGWDFQTTGDGGTAAAASPATPKVYTANVGAGTIYLDGSNGSSDWFVPASGTSNTELNAFGGTDVNATRGLSTVATSPSALALVGGASGGAAANNKGAVFKFSMTGRANLAVSYATQRTPTGFTAHVWEYSADGQSWSPLTTVSSGTTNGTITSAFATSGVITLATVAALDNAPTAYLRLTVTGATASTGNNRIDNIQLLASTYTPPDTTAPVITVLGENPLTLPVGLTFADPGATASDNVDTSVAVDTSGTVDTAVPGSYTVTYSAQDTAGNTATATRTVNVVDTSAPVINLEGSTPLYLPVGASFTEPGVSAVDAVDGAVAVQTAGSVNTAVRGTYTLDYSAVDAAGNTATATRQVIVRSAAAHLLATQYGLDGGNLGTDTDSDGAPDVMEYAFGKSPVSAAERPVPVEMVPTAEGLRFRAVVRVGDSALTVTPSASIDLQTWSDAGINEVQEADQAGVPAGFVRRTWEANRNGAAAIFLRLGIGYQ